MSGDYAAIMPHLWWVIGYAVVVLIVSVLVFRRKMRRDNI
jgi:ABC-2 type transport system permease protein